MKTLEQIHNEPFDKVSDKWSIYLREYDRLFSPMRDKPISLLEIGIQNGGSLERWSTYFAHGQRFVGCDINPDCERLVYNDPRIHLIVGDANQSDTTARILTCAPRFDIVIEDGSHTSGDIVRAFANFFPHIEDGGLFIAEDLHCSYWKTFDGGLFHPYSSMAFFKRLADVINHEHWGIGIERTQLMRDFCDTHKLHLPEELLASIHSVEFINSICVIRKDQPENNQLGSRQIGGNRELVVSGIKALHGTRNYSPDQESTPSGASAPTEGWQSDLLLIRLSDLKQEVTRLSEQVDASERAFEEQAQVQRLLKEELQTVYASKSWRMTALFRQAGQFLRSLLR
jgi:hypothetical protein